MKRNRWTIATVAFLASVAALPVQAQIQPYLYIRSRTLAGPAEQDVQRTVTVGRGIRLTYAEAFLQGDLARFDLSRFAGQRIDAAELTVCVSSRNARTPVEARDRALAADSMAGASSAWTEVLGRSAPAAAAAAKTTWSCPGGSSCPVAFAGSCASVKFQLPAVEIRTQPPANPGPALLQAPAQPVPTQSMVSGPASGATAPLHLAVRQRRLATVQSLLASGTDPNARDERGVTALHYAVAMRDPAIVTALLRAGADANLPGPAGHTAYENALNTRSADMIVPFVQSGADPAPAIRLAQDMNDEALLRAVSGGGSAPQAGGAPEGLPAPPEPSQAVANVADMAAFEELLRIRKYPQAEAMLSGVDPAEALRLAFKYDARPFFPALVRNGAPANEILRYAVTKRDSTLTRQCLTDFHADPNFALDLAMSARDLQLARSAMDLGADPNRAMENAAAQGAGPIVEELLRRNANPSLGLAAAANNGQTAIVEYLLAKGADPSAAVPGAIRKGDVSLLGKLIRANADVRAPEFVAAAASSPSTEMLRMLVAAGADPNAGLAGAVNANRVENVRFLLEKGANPGNPLLMEGAVRSGNAAMAALLLAKGGDATSGLPAAVAAFNAPMVEALLRSGAVPSDPHLVEVAAAKADSPILAMLLAAKADPNPGLWPAIRSGNGAAVTALLNAGAAVQTPEYILSACQNGLAGPARALLAHGAPKDARDSRNRSLLHLAVESWQPDLVKALIEAGADLNARNNAGDTALHIAAQDQSSRGYPSIRKGRNERLPIVRALIDAGADVNAVNERNETVLRVASGGDVKDLLKRAGATTEPKLARK